LRKYLALALGITVGIIVFTVVSAGTGSNHSAEAQQPNCSPAYPTICVPPPPPDLNCDDIPQFARFTVLAPDPHGFDGNDNDGVGCENNPGGGGGGGTGGGGQTPFAIPTLTSTSTPRPATPSPTATPTPRITLPSTGDGGLK
jgi:hypothetical protein